MLATTDSMSTLIVLDLVFAAIALAVGFAAGAWFYGGRTKADSSSQNGDEQNLSEKETLARERSSLASDRLRDLASAMASDVGDHSENVGQITADLRALDTTDIEATGAGVVSALSRIVEANDALQQRLAKAEEQIEAQAREIQTHETEARTDSLTSLANRRAFDSELKRRISEWERKQTPFTLAIMDIDFFKKFNDTHGHQAGDEVLRFFAKQLANTCRDMDLPCRYGGEEFAVIMPATETPDAKVGAERIRVAVEEMTVEFEGKQLKVTTSIGLAQVQADDCSASILKRADDALYQSKDAGRNCGHWHNGQKCLPFTKVKKQPKKAQDAGPKAQPEPESPAETPLLDSLPTRTKFADELRRRVSEASRTHQPLSVMVFQLGSYQDLQQHLGVEVSGLLLDSLASFLRKSLRDMDLVARLNDDTFGIMLPGSVAVDAAEAGERALQAMSSCAPPAGDGFFDLDMKYGVAELGAADTIESLVSRAESELAKFEAELVAAK